MSETLKSEQGNYVIPKKFRLVENLHIVFWLIKDLCWCLAFKPLGIIMIVPTLLIAIYITWQNRIVKSELYHNLAVIFWIAANGYWMMSEFFAFDATILTGTITGKHLAVIPFSIGILCLAVYYGIIMPKELKNLKAQKATE